MKKEQTRVILIGRTTAGKTTLCQRISHEELNYRKTQTITVVNGRMIDTPGEYLERRSFRGALMVSSVDADVVSSGAGRDRKRDDVSALVQQYVFKADRRRGHKERSCYVGATG